MKVIKFWAIGDDKKSLILLPSKVGLEIIKKNLTEKNIRFTEGVEKIDKVNLIAIIIPLSSIIKFLEFRIVFSMTMITFYLFLENEDKLHLTFSYEI